MICPRCIIRISRTNHVVSRIQSFSFKQFRNQASVSTSATPSSRATAPSRSDGSSAPEAPPVELPVSISPAGTVLRGLNYLKGRTDPIALPEEDYPSWLWTLLDEKKVDASEAEVADLFAKSKKLRRKAAKKQRKMEALRAASGEVSEVKVPITQQSIDLPSNENQTFEGAVEAVQGRKELRAALRSERRKAIKERNYLNSV